MNREEIDYWLRLFSNNNQSFMSKDGKKITLFKVFQELKELQYLLKIENDYINELEQENQELKEAINKSIEYIQNHQLVFRYHTTKEIDEWFNQFYKDLLKILKGGENE